MFQILMGGVGGPQRRASVRIDRRSGSDVPDTTSDFRLGSGPSSGPRTTGFIWTSAGGGRRLGGDGEGGSSDSFPPFASILFGGPMPPGGANREHEENGGPPAFLRHILMSVLGSPGGSGQYGDYVLDNEGASAPFYWDCGLLIEFCTALDQILTQLMEQSQGDKPVPAPDDMIESLPRGRVITDSGSFIPCIP